MSKINIRYCLKLDSRSHVDVLEFKKLNWLPTRVYQCIESTYLNFSMAYHQNTPQKFFAHLTADTIHAPQPNSSAVSLFLFKQSPNASARLPTYPFKMAAIMADEENGVKMDDRLIILKESLSLRRRAADLGKVSMLEVFVTTGNAWSMLDMSLKPVKGFSLVNSDCLLLRLGVY